MRILNQHLYQRNKLQQLKCFVVAISYINYKKILNVTNNKTFLLLKIFLT